MFTYLTGRERLLNRLARQGRICPTGGGRLRRYPIRDSPEHTAEQLSNALLACMTRGRNKRNTPGFSCGPGVFLTCRSPTHHLPPAAIVMTVPSVSPIAVEIWSAIMAIGRICPAPGDPRESRFLCAATP